MCQMKVDASTENVIKQEKEIEELKIHLTEREHAFKGIEVKLNAANVKLEQTTKDHSMLQQRVTEDAAKMKDLEYEKDTHKRGIDQLSKINESLKNRLQQVMEEKNKMEEELNTVKTSSPRQAWAESKPSNDSDNSSAQSIIQPTGTTIDPGTKPSGNTTIKVEHHSVSAAQSVHDKHGTGGYRWLVRTHALSKSGVHSKVASGDQGQVHAKHGTGGYRWFVGPQADSKSKIIGNINQLLKWLSDESTLLNLSKEEIAKKIATIDCKSVETEITKVAVMTKELRKDLALKTKQLEKLEEQYKASCNFISKNEARVKELEIKINKRQQKSKQTDVNHTLTEENRTLKTEIYDLQKRLGDTEAEKKKIDDELLKTKIRQSRVLGSKLTDGNADIADLSDENRPTKIAEKYSELYANQWTDAFEVFLNYGWDDKKIIASLLDILLTVKQHCDGISATMTQGLVAAITITAKTEGVSTIPDLVNKQLKDLKKLSAGVSVTTVFDMYMDKASKMWTAQNTLHKALRESAIKVYIKECTSLCWLMCVQDPPLVINGSMQQADTFNSNHLKEYLQSGPVIDFLVWPPLFLEEGGSLLCKGIAQGIQISEKEERKVHRPSSPDDPASAKNEHQQKPHTAPLAQTAPLKKGKPDQAELKQSSGLTHSTFF